MYLAKLDFDSLEYIREVYRDLTDESLLRKCLKKRTQNPNESFHAKVWQKCSKAKHHGYFRVKFASQVTVLEHNFGYQDVNLLREMFGTNPAIEKVLKRKESRKITPTKGKHKKNVKEAPSEEYKPGEY